MALGVPSPPWLCNRSGVVLLFTAYGEARNSWGVGERRGRVGWLRLGQVWFGFLMWLWKPKHDSRLRLTIEQSQVWLRGQTAVSGNLFLSAEQQCKVSRSGNQREKEWKGIQEFHVHRQKPNDLPSLSPLFRRLCTFSWVVFLPVEVLLSGVFLLPLWCY